MKKVITYGTYDLLHQGHLNLLKKAKELGDYLIVGVTSDSYDRDRGKLSVKNNVLERVEAVRRSGYADEIIIEDYFGQKIDDIQKYDVDIFAIGSDWEGKFDYLKDYCDVVYLPRTQGISSTQLREQEFGIVKLGIIGSGRIARRFVPESKMVNGIDVTSVYNPEFEDGLVFAKEFNLSWYNNLGEFLKKIDAVYIASPHLSHYSYIKAALESNRHVLCEIPMVLSGSEAEELFRMAKERGLVLLEASKTAHCPAWNHLLTIVKSGIIGEIVDVKASLSKLVPEGVRELDKNQAGGSVNELAHFPLMAIIKLLGKDYNDISFYSKIKGGIDIFTRANITYPHAVASITLGLGVKTEGNLVVSGTKGYVLVPSPWWLTNYFEVNFEDRNKNKRYFYPFEGDGLRYEIQEFISMIANSRLLSYKLTDTDSLTIAKIIESYSKGDNLTII